MNPLLITLEGLETPKTAASMFFIAEKDLAGLAYNGLHSYQYYTRTFHSHVVTPITVQFRPRQ
jgi:hypothetical protein